MSVAGLCILSIIIASIGLIVWGLFDILKEKEKHETDIQVIQRQIRGFGYLILSWFVLIIGMSLCTIVGGVSMFLL